MSCDTRVPLPRLDSAGEAYEKLRSQDAATAPGRVVTRDRPGASAHGAGNSMRFPRMSVAETDVAALRDPHNIDA